MNATNAQLAPPGGPHPEVSVLFVGALLWSASAEVADVLNHVADDDVEDAALAPVLAAIRTLVGAGKPPAPQLILDELRRTGNLRGNVPARLRSAVTSGACASAVRHYAAATVSDSLRRRIESAGHALTEAARTASEADLAPLVERSAATVVDLERRLAALRD